MTGDFTRAGMRELAEQRRIDKAAKLEKMLKLHREGLPPRLIAVRLGVASVTVSKAIRTAGMEPVHHRASGDFTYGDEV